MTVNNAKEMLCPYTHTECKVDKCMSWIMTVNGKRKLLGIKYHTKLIQWKLEESTEDLRLKGMKKLAKTYMLSTKKRMKDIVN